MHNTGDGSEILLHFTC